MRAWAAGALPDGMIQEQLGCGCMDAVPRQLDDACGRVMGDVSSMFIVYLLEWHSWRGNGSALVTELWPTAKRAAEWQMARSARVGLPEFMVDTYDGLGLQVFNVSTFSALFHLLAMRAAAELARAPLINDDAFAAKCDTAYAIGLRATDALLWNSSHGFYRSYTGANAIHADALYAQVLADSLGLGALTSDEQVRRHLRTVLDENSTPYGFLVQTGRYAYPGPNPRFSTADNSVWMMANPNWATLSLWRGGPVSEALSVANQTLGWWRSHLNDMWNVVALNGGLGYGMEGQPMANSHYGYHIVAWHMLFALSGQRYSAPERALAFTPRLTPPYELPVLVPGSIATIGAAADGRFTLTVVAGSGLALARLAVSNAAPPPGSLPRTIEVGESLTWSQYTPS